MSKNCQNIITMIIGVTNNVQTYEQFHVLLSSYWRQTQT